MRARLLAAALCFAAAPAFAGAPADPERRAEEMLLQAFFAFFVEDPGNVPALETASLLAEGKVTIDLQVVWNDEVLASYDGGAKAIVLNVLPFLSRYGSGRWVTEEFAEDFRRGLERRWQEDPGSLRDFVERTAPLLVHEARHARYDRELDATWNTLEEELACRTHEVLFLRAHLRRDPGYLRYVEYDRLMRRLTGEDPASGAWWEDPLPEGASAEALERAMTRVRRQFLGEFEDIDSEWRLLRAFNGDPQAFWDTMQADIAGYYDSVDQDGKDIVLLQRLRLERLESAAAAETDPRRREGLKRAVGREASALGRSQVFWDDPVMVRRYRAFFAEELEALRARIGRERASRQDPVAAAAPEGTR